MRKVLFVLADFEPGGAERVITTLAQHLPRDQFELHLALVAARGRLRDQLPADVRVHDLAARRVRWAALPLCRLIRRLRPDVVLSTLGYVNIALILLRPFLPRGIPLIVREANTPSAELAGVGWPRLWRAAYRGLYPRAAAIVCPARSICDDLADGFGVPRSKLRHIPNPVDVGRVRESTRASSSPYTETGPHVLGVGRLVAQKGFDRLIDGFARVVREHGTAQLWILGEGPERAALVARAEAQGIAARVHLPGDIADPYPWMSHADVFVLSSRFEGLPNVVLEALACGTRVVAFDAPGGSREILEGLAGTLLVADGDLDALAVAITRCLGPSPPPQPELPVRFHLEAALQAYAELLSAA